LPRAGGFQHPISSFDFVSEAIEHRFQINQKLLAKQYKVSVETLKKHMSQDYKSDPLGCRIKAAQKRYYQHTREARLSYQKGYDDKNREQIRACKRKT
ncbi:hypothetical protein PHMEG_00041810, partial [Phytophthora megakarya]